MGMFSHEEFTGEPPSLISGKVLDPKIIQPDGGLYSMNWYLNWNIGEEFATLDGEFTAEELRAIADHMEKLNEARS